METEKKKALGIVALVLGGYALICVLGNGYSYYREFVACEVNPVTGRTKAEDQVWVAEMTKERLAWEEEERKIIESITLKDVCSVYAEVGGNWKELGRVMYQRYRRADGTPIFGGCDGGGAGAYRVIKKHIDSKAGNDLEMHRKLWKEWGINIAI